MDTTLSSHLSPPPCSHPLYVSVVSKHLLSGHVAMDTVQLSVEQKAALAAWEQMEKSYNQSEESEDSSDAS